MLVIRPVKRSDLNQLYHLSGQTKAGLTTLPHDKALLTGRIEDSLQSFRKKFRKITGEYYFLVLEDTKTRRIYGTAGIFSQVGVGKPSYTYKVMTTLNVSELLKVRREIRYLRLKKEYNGPSEVGTLFLSPHFRERGVGRLLSLCRFLFIAQYPDRFKSRVIAELRGVLDKENRSPFWNAVCKHFFVVNFRKADLMVMRDKTFIEDLIPKHPLYIPILPKKAQMVLGKLHEDTKPAWDMLKQEGFYFIDEIDIFEAGPVAEARTKFIRTIQKSRVLPVKQVVKQIDAGELYLMANVSSMQNFRVMMGKVVPGEKGVTITKETALGLKARAGTPLRIVKAKG